VKVLERFLVDARSRSRAARARLGVPSGAPRPAFLVLRLDDLDAPGGPGGAEVPAGGWDTAAVRVLEWCGPLPARVVARADHPQLPDVVRFLHRLECPVSLRTCARGLGPDRAAELVDAGLQTVSVRVAGATDEVQRAVLGESVAEGVEAFRSLLTARHSRGARLQVLAEAVLTEVSAPQLQDVFSASRSAGLDGVVLAAPWLGVPSSEAVRAAVTWARTQHPPFHRTPSSALAHLSEAADGQGPGVGRRSGACAVGGLRLEIGPDGRLSHCPFQAGAVAGSDDARADARALSGQRAAIRACRRSCVHPDLLG
jgi:hypothetical protein